MREVVPTSKPILQQRGGSVRDSVGLVPAVQWALNTAYHEHYGSTPYRITCGKPPMTARPPLLLLVVSSAGNKWNVEAIARGSVMP